MRIHRLEISAFGPFAGTEHIDFDRLSAHGLFLLNGPTGAGKTSVLDAICYALYGSVPGARQDGKRLRSDHADAAAEPRVTCEFSARGRHFEVSRAPAWDKPSARGKNGFTVQQATTLLRERVDGTWVEKSGRNDEAGAEITDLLGMNREQFTRVVMLPQGEFAAFLRSKAADRLDLLQSLFGTHRFEAVEQELQRQALGARAEVQTLTGRLEMLLAQAEAETAGLGLEPGSGPDPAPDRVQPDAWLDWLVRAAAAAAERRDGAAGTARRAHAAAAGAQEAAAAVASRQGKLAAAEIRRTEAAAAAPRLAADVNALERHRSAAVLTGQLLALNNAEAARKLAETGVERAAADLRAAALTDPELSGLEFSSSDPADLPGLAAVRAELERLRSLRAVLEERLPDEARLAGLTSRAAGLGAELARLRQQNHDCAASLAGLRHESAALSAALLPLTELAAELPVRTKEASAAQELVAIVDRHAAAVVRLGNVAERHRLARTDHQDRRQAWLDLREERLANAAAELAAQLRPGTGCPVCGSAEHPAPAAAASAALGIAEAETAAQDACEAAEAILAGLDKDLAGAQQEVAVLSAQGGDLDPDAARADAALAAERSAEAVRAAADLAAGRLRRDGLEEEIARVEEALAASAAGMAQTDSTLAEVRGQEDAVENALANLRAGHGTLAGRLARLQAAVKLLEGADSARAGLDQAGLRSAEAAEQLALALPEAGFASAEAARGVLLPAGDAQALEASIRAGQDEQARIQELFDGEELLLAARERESGEAVDGETLAGCRADAEAAEAASREAALAAALAAQSVRNLGRIAADFADQAAAGKEPRDRAALLASVSDAARGAGENTYRMSLNTYVLAARLEQVAVAASERLTGMSDGRYILQHTDAKAARGAKSGLGLEVVDQWTGQRRDTATLSGGESFIASLALALGLADVVQHEAGGVDIETLFVDEGFGTLDEQSLEQVMDALEGLRDGGRVVGLVSHVGEMKQRIGTQLQVLKRRNGSTLQISDDAPA